MTAYDVLQTAIVGAALLASALYALGRVAPGLRRRCGTSLMQSTRPRWLQYVGARLAGSGGGCGDGCNTCGSCGPTSKVDDSDRHDDRLRKIPVDHL